MDRYEVEQIARDAASSAAGDVQRALQYEVDSLRRDLSTTQQELESERQLRRAGLAELLGRLAEAQRVTR